MKDTSITDRIHTCIVVNNEDMDLAIITALAVLVTSQQQRNSTTYSSFIAISNSMIDDDLLEEDDMISREYERATMRIMRNDYIHHPPEMGLGTRVSVLDLFQDLSRNECKTLIGFTSHEFFALSDIVTPFLLGPRVNAVAQPRAGKFQPFERLFFLLNWLHSGIEYKVQESYYGYSKSSLQADRIIVLAAINEALNDQIVWPTAEERRDIAGNFFGAFEGCVGILDCTEHRVFKPLDSDTEKRRRSGKLKSQYTIKTLSIVDPRGLIIYLDTGIATGICNDRSAWMSESLFLNCHEYFDPGQYVAADGAFDGCGPQCISFKDIEGLRQRELFQGAFTEARTATIENNYGRVNKWFPILGIDKKYFNYNETMLIATVRASSNMHNWLMRIRDLDYNPQSNPSYIYRDYY